jgi:hypothetical protein
LTNRAGLSESVPVLRSLKWAWIESAHPLVNPRSNIIVFKMTAGSQDEVRPRGAGYWVITDVSTINLTLKVKVQ